MSDAPPSTPPRLADDPAFHNTYFVVIAAPFLMLWFSPIRAMRSMPAGTQVRASTQGTA
ncbi:hypothetical protein ABCR94_00220 [Streptomyces sp. 21So2-11]|uniref:hypothetical protein n=1 Tax=Streptomyces sp. 21So2-11 TaxID=3144408 RepID=UPI003218F733